MIDPAKFAAFAPRALPGTREALEAAAAINVGGEAPTAG
jgi:hypothetical protein